MVHDDLEVEQPLVKPACRIGIGRGEVGHDAPDGHGIPSGRSSKGQRASVTWRRMKLLNSTAISIITPRNTLNQSVFTPV